VSRRPSLEALRASPALVANLPADVVDLDRLITHLASRGFGGAVHVAGGGAQGLLWVYDGAPREAWIFEPGGTEAVVQGEGGRGLVRQMAANGGTISVHPGTLPAASPLPAVERDITIEPIETDPEPSFDHSPSEVELIVPRSEAVAVGTAWPAEGAPEITPEEDPSPLPWPAILEEVAERVARHRGVRLASRFMAALEAALAPYGGRVINGQINTPPLARSTWRIVVETACAPVVAIAGRAFVDRTIAAAERHVAGGKPKAGGTA
jgi:hypothetical protein